MNREQIKDLFPTVKNNPFVEHRITNIEDRIKNIEDEGYTFQGIHTEKIRTELRPAGSFDFFDPNGFERMSGEELTIATFKNEEDKQAGYSPIYKNEIDVYSLKDYDEELEQDGFAML